MARSEVPVWRDFVLVVLVVLALIDKCECDTPLDGRLPDVRSALVSVDLPPLNFEDCLAIDMFDRIHKLGNGELARHGYGCGFSMMIKTDKSNAFRSIRIPQTNILEALRFVADKVDCDVKVDTLVWILSRTELAVNERDKKVERGLRTLHFDSCRYRDAVASNVVCDVWRKANAKLESCFDVVADVFLPREFESKKITINIPSTNLWGAFECVAEVLDAKLESRGSTVGYVRKCIIDEGE